MTDVASESAWRLALIPGLAAEFEPADWLKAESECASNPTSTPVRTSIEVRRYYGGRAPVALLGASFTPSEIGQCELAVGHTDEDWPTPERWANRQLVGLLGQPLCAGLTVPFARAALHGLMHAPADMPAGRLEVRAGAFDVESSEAMFKLAGDLLRHAVARLAVGEACAAQDLLRMAMDHP